MGMGGGQSGPEAAASAEGGGEGPRGRYGKSVLGAGGVGVDGEGSSTS